MTEIIDLDETKKKIMRNNLAKAQNKKAMKAMAEVLEKQQAHAHYKATVIERLKKLLYAAETGNLTAIAVMAIDGKGRGYSNVATEEEDCAYLVLIGLMEKSKAEILAEVKLMRRRT